MMIRTTKKNWNRFYELIKLLRNATSVVRMPSFFRSVCRVVAVLGIPLISTATPGKICIEGSYQVIQGPCY